MRRKILSLTSLVFLMVSTGTALSFSVNIDSVTDADAHFPKHDDNTTLVHETGVTLENTGSIGCVYRLKGKYRYGNKTQIRYSNPYPLRPSQTVDAELFFLPENYSGNVQVQLYSTYCDRENLIEEFNFTSLSQNIANNTLESRTRDVTEESAEVEVETEQGILVPQETPPYWKASSAKIRNGSATIHYDPPIYDDSRNLTYTVVNKEGILGTTKIRLKEQTTYMERLKENAVRILAVLLAFSLILNTKVLMDLRRRKK